MSQTITQPVTAPPSAVPTSVAASYRRLHERRQRRLAYLAADTGMLLLAVAAAIGSPGARLEGKHDLWALAFVAVTLVVLQLRGFYRFRLSDAPIDELGRITAGTAIAAMVLIGARVLLDSDLHIAGHTARLWAFATVFLGAGRAGIALDARRGRRKGSGGFNTLVVGAGTVGRLIARRLLERPELGLRPVGFLDKDPLPLAQDQVADLEILGASWDLEEVAEQRRVSYVIITFSTAPHEVLLNLVRRCRKLGITVLLVPRLFEEVGSRLDVEHLGGVALLRTEQADPRGWQFAIKYALDRLLAAIAVLVLAPFGLVVAAAIRLSSPGPVFYRQRRVGLDGREFDIFKFRTMSGDATTSGENDAAWFAALRGEQAEAAAPVPDRRTPIGRFLRKYSLDELPQLINVLVGDMSFIGPRPERTNYVRSFEGHVYRYGDRHRVRSGLTGWAQVHGLRGETSLADRVEWDNYYIENWSPWLDVKILAMTLGVVLRGEAA